VHSESYRIVYRIVCKAKWNRAHEDLYSGSESTSESVSGEKKKRERGRKERVEREGASELVKWLHQKMAKSL
jgi:hypothetical protein